MDAFESLVSMLLRHDGYWTASSFKVKLTPEDKLKIGRPSSPRWELDLIAKAKNHNNNSLSKSKSKNNR